jgi:acyl-CoA thioesterase II
MGDLALDTRPTGGDGRYTINLSRDWQIMGPNGGYLAAIALQSAGLEAKIRRPASISCHFLAVARFEPVDIEVRALQQGRRAEAFHVAMTQGGRAIVQAIVRTAAEGPGLEHLSVQMPVVPPPSALKSFVDNFPDAPEGPRFWTNFDSRIIYPERVFATEPTVPELMEWHSFAPRATFDDPFDDACRYVVLLDTFAWPAAGNLQGEPREFQGVNVDVTAWFHDPVPDEKWLLCDYRSEVGKAGLVWSGGRVWSPDGRLAATGGAHLMCLPASIRDEYPALG